MDKIILLEKIGEYCISIEDGERLHGAIFESLKNGKKIILDFKGLKNITTSFLNYAVGQLVNEFSSEILNNLLIFENTTPPIKKKLEYVIENAQEGASEPGISLEESIRKYA